MRDGLSSTVRRSTNPASKVAELRRAAARDRDRPPTCASVGCRATRSRRWVRNGHLHEKHRGVYAVGHRELTVEGALAGGGEGVWQRGCAKPLRRRRAVGARGLGRAQDRRDRADDAQASRHQHAPDDPPGSHVAQEHPGHFGAAHAGGPRLDAAVHGVPTSGAASVQPPPGHHRRDRASQVEATPAIAADIVPTESILEDLVHDLIREAGFDEPLVNVPLGSYKPDFRWPHRGLIVEADGAGTHDNDLARHDDAVRTDHLPDRVVRVTWKQAVLQPAKTVARLRAEERARRGASSRGCAGPSPRA